MKKRAALVYSPSGMGPYDGETQAFHDNFGVLPSLSLGYVAAVLEREGWECRYFDIVAHGYNAQTLGSAVRAFDPDFSCFTVYTYHFHENRNWIRLVRQATQKPTLVGGIHTGIYPAETFSYEELDFGLIGEAETNLPAFLEAFANQSGWAEVPGLIWRDHGEIRVNPSQGLIEDVDRSPRPARHLWPIDRYYTIASARRNFTPMVTSRGCPYKCIFCEQGNLSFRPHSPEYVVDEIEECIKRFGVREIDMFDSQMTVKKSRMLEICELIQKRGLEFHWSARSRVDTVNMEVLQAMRSAGCDRIFFGIESGDEQILKNLKKKTSIDRIRQTMKECKEVGIQTLGFFMVGSPGETMETAEKSLALAIELDLDYAQFNGVRAIPGTELYDMVLPEQGEDYWRSYILDPSKSEFVARAQCNLTQEEINTFLKKCYRRFYYRPSYIMSRLKKINTWEEFRKHAKAGIDLLLK
ncbi:MAG: radical SAM protein [Magnetococcales bacterium]|nr:radical SAM protein [Magnetococcales bacterium]MBF0348237.1 radical SAM protein [Magnetococcales bacterium]